MKIMNYELPFIDKLIPYGLTGLVAVIFILFIKNIYADKDITIQKIALKLLACTLVIASILSLPTLTNWVCGLLGKIIEMTNTL